MSELEKCELARQQYIGIIEHYKCNTIALSRVHPGFSKHHPIPRSFSKITHKHEYTRLLENKFTLNEIVLVPDRVHFQLHMLLVEMYPERTQEWFKMCNALEWFRGKRSGRYDITPEEHEFMNCIFLFQKKERKILVKY